MTSVVTRTDRLPAPGLTSITDEQLLRLSIEERRALARRLERLPGGRPTPAQRRLFVLAVASTCAALVAWIVAQARTLPARYVVDHWDTAWVGFDLILLASLTTLGWAAWRGHRAFPAASLVTAVLLGCDAWFDVTTAGAGDAAVSVLTAAVVELPLAAGLCYPAYRRYVRRADH
jgi:hypothetical protein